MINNSPRRPGEWASAQDASPAPAAAAVHLSEATNGRRVSTCRSSAGAWTVPATLAPQPPGYGDNMQQRYPASPNYPPGMSGSMPTGQPGMQQQQPMAPQQQARRLDPDQMPSAIQV